MGQRGRQSSKALEATADADAYGMVTTLERPEPPNELTAGQAEIWRAIVSHEPADWFSPSTLPLLKQYCMHVSRARRLGNLLNAMERAEEFDPKEYRDLLRAESQQSDALARLATKMRLSQQSTYDRQKRKPVGPRPWEPD